ncbi:MAG: type II toxin-antitoxin system HicA family toxin [Candidatus Nanoarchaeia archaeon]
MKLPKLTGRELIVLLQKAGFKVIGQRGKHVSLRKGERRLIIPYNETLEEQTMLNIIDQAELSGKDILNLLHDKGPAKPKDIPDEFVEETVDQEPVPIIAMGFGRESWYGMSWSFPTAILRILLGILFLDFALGKAPPSFGWFTSIVQNNIGIPSFPLYQSFFENVVQHNMQFFGWLQFIIELAVGIGLLFGILTVLSGIVGAAWVTWFAIGAMHWPHEWAWSYILWIAACLAVAFAKSGRSLGADLRIFQKCENNRTSKWSKVFSKLV